MPIFCVKSVKNYTGQKKFTRAPLVVLVTNIRYVWDPVNIRKYFTLLSRDMWKSSLCNLKHSYCHEVTVWVGSFLLFYYYFIIFYSLFIYLFIIFYLLFFYYLSIFSLFFFCNLKHTYCHQVTMWVGSFLQ